MRLTTVILIATLMQVSAATFGQRITINERKASFEQVLKSIRSQSGYDVIMDRNILKKAGQVNISVKDATIDEAMKSLLSGLPLKYTIDGKIIVIEEKSGSIIDNIIARFQAIDVRGKVVDSLGNGLPGATISVKNGKGSTSTDAGGNFQLKNVDEGAVLVVSYLGYVTREIAVGKEFINLVLQQSESRLDEVQIQAYGVTSRRLSTANISTIKADEIRKSPVGNPLLAIAGRAPGVFIQQSSGIPGSGIKIVIQGQNSYLNDSDPFYVIDGVPYTSQLLPGLSDDLGSSGTGVNGIRPPTAGNPLNFINPQDIESIDILKDAEATSIYGSRAANGAVIITTKRGKAGKTTVDIDLQSGWGEVGRKLSLLNTKQYLDLRKEAYKNDNSLIPTSPTGGAYDVTFWDQNRYTDWQEELLGGSASYTNVMGSISGGSKNSQYLASFGYQQQGTVTPGELRDQKASVHFNLNTTSENKKFKIDFSTNYVADDNKLASINSLVSYAYTAPPNSPPLYTSTGELNWEFLPNSMTASFQNPLALLDRGYINKTSNLVSNLIASYDLPAGFNFKTSFGYNILQSNEVQTTPSTAFMPSVRQTIVRRSNFNDSKISSWIIEPQLTFTTNVVNGRLDALLGSTLQQQDKDRQRLNASGFTSDQSMFNIKAASTVVVDGAANAVILSRYKYNALFFRLNYNNDDKYIVSVSGRRDGSSRFGRKNQFHNFGSVSGAWIMSNEAFFKSLGVISFAKLRASFGTTGNDQIGDYSYLNLYSNISGLGTPYQGITGLQPTSGFLNPYLQWEETRKFSTTLDLGVFKDRILMSGTYFKNRSSNQLVNDPLPAITGGSFVYQNKPITIHNSGFEFGLNTVNINKIFSWSTSFNLTVPRNVLKRYDDLDKDVKSDLVGKSLTTMKLFRYAGVDPTTGLYVFENRNGEVTSNPNPDVDKFIFVNADPKYYGGLANSFGYKNFSLDFLLQYTKQMAPNEFFGNYPGANAFNQFTSVLDRWQNQGDDARIQAYHVNFNANQQWSAAKQSDKAYSDASYVRLKNVSFSYRFSTSLMNKLNIHSARIYLQGQNLLTFTKYIGADPENRTLVGMPLLRTYALGFQISF